MIEYELRRLVDFYDPILRQPTIPFDFASRKDAELVAYTLTETMSYYGGLGLSANQIGLKDRVCAVNMGKEAWVIFNPEIIERSAVPSKYQEGCLSYPGFYLKLDRAEWVKVKFQDMNGDWNEQRFDGLTAVCVQHELDHLDGILYTDKVSSFRLDQAKRKVKKNVKRLKMFAAQKAEAESRIERQVTTEKQALKPIVSQELPQIQIIIY